MSVLITEQLARPSKSRPVPAAAAFGIILIALLVLATLFAPLLTSQPPSFGDLGAPLSPPSAAHPFGTDGAGRDILARLLYGGRLSLLGPLLVVLLAALIGVPLGIAAGYMQGWLDAILSRSFDVLFAFPALLLAAVIVATF